MGVREQLEELSEEYSEAVFLNRKRERPMAQRRIIERKEKLLHGELVCFNCLKSVDIDDCTKEHIIPRCYGGSNALMNLALSHRECNEARGKEFTKRGELKNSIGKEVTNVAI